MIWKNIYMPFIPTETDTKVKYTYFAFKGIQNLKKKISNNLDLVVSEYYGK